MLSIIHTFTYTYTHTNTHTHIHIHIHMIHRYTSRASFPFQCRQFECLPPLHSMKTKINNTSFVINKRWHNNATANATHTLLEMIFNVNLIYRFTTWRSILSSSSSSVLYSLISNPLQLISHSLLFISLFWYAWFLTHQKILPIKRKPNQRRSNETIDGKTPHKLRFCFSTPASQPSNIL